MSIQSQSVAVRMMPGIELFDNGIEIMFYQGQDPEPFLSAFFLYETIVEDEVNMASSNGVIMPSDIESLVGIRQGLVKAVMKLDELLMEKSHVPVEVQPVNKP